MMRFKTRSGTTYELDLENETVARLGDVPIMNTDRWVLEKTGEEHLKIIGPFNIPALGERFRYSTELYPYMTSTEVVEILEEVGDDA